jgi:hypothetical protein
LLDDLRVHLAQDAAEGRRELPPCLIAAFNEKGVVDAIQRAIPIPKVDIATHLLRGGTSLGRARHLQPVESTDINPLTT